MAMAYKYGPMEHNIKDFGKMAKPQAKENLFM